MSNTELKPCPFCDGEAELIRHRESTDGSRDDFAYIRCSSCKIKMFLTLEEYCKAEKDFEYTGGYYSQNNELWDGIHRRLVEKWNRRVSHERI